MSARYGGLKFWQLRSTAEGIRTYSARYRVYTDDVNDGPKTVMECPGLPLVGDNWDAGNDYDPYVWCSPEAEATPLIQEETNTEWDVSRTFTNNSLSRCANRSFENPLDEPAKASGSFVTYVRHAELDMDGNPLINSSYQYLKEFFPDAVEKDAARPTVTIEMNIPTLPLSSYIQMIHTVNDDVMWGLAARTVKLSRITWTRKLFGICTYYYTQGLDFDIQLDGFDHTIPDYGSKVLRKGGKVGNYRDYIEYHHPVTNATGAVFLNGAGVDAKNSNELYVATVRLYSESNFFILGIPTRL